MNEKPWLTEPDSLDWTSEHGFVCAIRRVPYSGHLCGYIGVPADHPWHGRGYDDINADVHGGLTYADPELMNAPKGWWIGFDCAHSGDLSPRSFEREPDFYGRFGSTYRDIPYVRGEVESLARQAAERWGTSMLEVDIRKLEVEIAEAQERIGQARARIALLRGADLAPALGTPLHADELLS